MNTTQRDSMAKWERISALAGIVAVALWLIGILILELGAGVPDTEPTGQASLDYFQDEEGTILTGSFIFMLGALVFMWFVSALRSRLWWAEGGTGRLSALVFGTGLAVSLFALMIGATQAAGAFNSDDLSPQAAQVFLGMDDAFFFAAELSAAALMVATAILILRTGALPRWLAWASLVIAVVLLIPPIGWAGLIFLVPAWTIVVSFLIYTARPGPIGPPPHTAQFVGTE